MGGEDDLVSHVLLYRFCFGQRSESEAGDLVVFIAVRTGTTRLRVMSKCPLFESLGAMRSAIPFRLDADSYIVPGTRVLLVRCFLSDAKGSFAMLGEGISLLHRMSSTRNAGSHHLTPWQTMITALVFHFLVLPFHALFYSAVQKSRC